MIWSLAHLLSLCWQRRTPARESADRQGKQQLSHSNNANQPKAVPACSDIKQCSTLAEQAVVKLQDVYSSMAAGFSAQGLDLAAVAETAAWFEAGPPAPWPRRYANFTPHPLPPSSVRLLVVPLADNCPRVASTAAAVAADILGLLPPGCKVFINARQNLHITVFHFSHPLDTRPDAIDPCSGLPQCIDLAEQQTTGARRQQQQQTQQLGQLTGIRRQPQHQCAGDAAAAAEKQLHLQELASGTPSLVQVQHRALDAALLPAPHARPGPTAQQLAAEQAAAAAIASATPPFTLQLERVLLARSGVLLLAWSDTGGAATALRRSLQARFPGACSKQSNIIHTSLLRIVETPAASTGQPQGSQQGRQQGRSSSACRQLSQAAVGAITAACERWTNKLRGKRLAVCNLWWVCEEEFSSIQGQRMLLPCTVTGVPQW